MEGGHLVVDVKDKTLEIVGTDISRLTFNGQPANTQSATFKLTEQLTYLSSEGLSIEEFVTEDSGKRVWIIHIPKHLPRLPVLAHKKAWQRIEDSLVEMTNERMSVILEEPIYIIIPQKCYLAFLKNVFLTQMLDIFSTNLFVCCKYANYWDELLSVWLLASYAIFRPKTKSKSNVFWGKNSSFCAKQTFYMMQIGQL